MSDVEGDDLHNNQRRRPGVAAGGEKSTSTLHCRTLKTSLYQRLALSRGRQALMCVLADDCDEAMYKKLVIALCTEHNIPLLRVDNNKKLGEWAGLCKIDKEGKARKVVRCSCVVVKDYGGDSPAKDQVLEYIKTQDSRG
ncbi:40S ribosomal protein S12 [Orchesella cincta]|uniref:40S ribosomal protein S12 n=1 Tax=Orchesella cincta TaxID=48709 RepID=A0A1D2MJ61_ORCCI|nr:40S ribosomal protein S12 [Orchesella cincta]